MKFSIIGTGFIFPLHTQAIRDIGGEIVDVVNESHGPDAWKEMVKTTKADCVVILTPNDLHFEMAMAAADNDKIVLCEKPLVIKSEYAKILATRKNIFTVLQLRHHPFAKQLKAEIKPDNRYEIEMDISVYRDEKYYQSWKAIKERSGGLLFNLGIHYFDMLLYLFGEAKKATTHSLNEKTGFGVIEGDNYTCHWRVSTDEKKENQRRTFRINGVDYNFSSKDNLSYESLHRFVYQNLLEGKGVLPGEILKSIELVEKLYANILET